MNIKIKIVVLLSLFLVILFPKDAQAAECSATTSCGNSCTYEGVAYNTVQIGTQCWFKENLNAGIMLGNTDTPDNTAPTPNDPNTASKWCFNNSSTYCSNEGGLYTWAEANGLANSCNSTSCNVQTPNQGICPAGWHIPTDTEQFTLENYLITPGQTCDPLRSSDDNAWGCSDAGTKLKISGSSGFDALSAGNHETNGEASFFDKREPSIHFWSSSEQLLPQVVPDYAWQRTLGAGYDMDMVYRSNTYKAHGLSVRCLADTKIDQDGDGINDNIDNCPNNVNPDQVDNDQDGQGDVCDLDKDGDGIANTIDCNPDNGSVAVNNNTKACILYKSDVFGKGILNALGLLKPFNPKSPK